MIEQLARPINPSSLLLIINKFISSKRSASAPTESASSPDSNASSRICSLSPSHSLTFAHKPTTCHPLVILLVRSSYFTSLFSYLPFYRHHSSALVSLDLSPSFSLVANQAAKSACTSSVSIRRAFPSDLLVNSPSTFQTLNTSKSIFNPLFLLHSILINQTLLSSFDNVAAAEQDT
jgi:hypothetical protein